MAFKYKSSLTNKEIPTPKIWRDSGGNPTRFGWTPDIIVLHIMEGTLAGTDSWFSQNNNGGSAHYGIGGNGEVHQYADEAWAPWANGSINSPTARLVKERGSNNPNFYTISIEHEGWTGQSWSETLFQKSVELTADICKRWSIPADRDHIIGHYEIDSRGRPNCPGTGLTSRWNEYISRVNNILNPVQPEPEPEPEPQPEPEPDTTDDWVKNFNIQSESIEFIENARLYELPSIESMVVSILETGQNVVAVSGYTTTSSGKMYIPRWSYENWQTNKKSPLWLGQWDIKPTEQKETSTLESIVKLFLDIINAILKAIKK